MSGNCEFIYNVLQSEVIFKYVVCSANTPKILLKHSVYIHLTQIFIIENLERDNLGILPKTVNQL